MFLLVKTQDSMSILTILCVEQHLIEIRLVVIKGLLDFVYRLLVGQVTIHETAKLEKKIQISD